MWHDARPAAAGAAVATAAHEGMSVFQPERRDGGLALRNLVQLAVTSQLLHSLILATLESEAATRTDREPASQRNDGEFQVGRPEEPSGVLQTALDPPHVGAKTPHSLRQRASNFGAWSAADRRRMNVFGQGTRSPPPTIA
jgi:hypothetical protein